MKYNTFLKHLTWIYLLNKNHDNKNVKVKLCKRQSFMQNANCNW